MEIKVNKEKCIICGMCASTEPDVFKFTDSGEIEAHSENITEENKETVEEAKNNCPVGAIEKEKDD